MPTWASQRWQRQRVGGPAAAAGLVVLLAGGCGDEPQVDVVLELPAGLRPDGLRLVKLIDEQEREALYRPVTPALLMNQDLTPIRFLVAVPGDRSIISLRAEALLDAELLAEGQPSISAAMASPRLSLRSVAAAAAAAVPIEAAPATQPWVAPACQEPVGGSAAPVVNRPATVSAGCDRYCAAMQVNCPTFLRSR